LPGASWEIFETARKPAATETERVISEIEGIGGASFKHGVGRIVEEPGRKIIIACGHERAQKAAREYSLAQRPASTRQRPGKGERVARGEPLMGRSRAIFRTTYERCWRKRKKKKQRAVQGRISSNEIQEGLLPALQGLLVNINDKHIEVIARADDAGE